MDCFSVFAVSTIRRYCEDPCLDKISPFHFISEIIATRTATLRVEVMHSVGVPNDDLAPMYSSDQLRRRI